MIRLLFACVFLLTCLFPLEVLSQAKVKPFGEYQKVWSDGEHASGYSLSLWMEGGKLIGIIRVHSGLVGDPPAGLLEDVSYSARTHKFSFKAKWSAGLYSDPTHRDVPSQDVLSFTGVVTQARVKGKLVLDNLLCGPGCRKVKQINLRRSKEWSASLEVFSNHEEWKKRNKVIFDRYGPKW